jgi:alpha-beta hydrolase superfamily lysophospholipase
MAPSMLWLPEDHEPGHPKPAFVFVHRWGGYPHEELPRDMGSSLADRGFGFLSLCLRRRGMEGQLMSVPDDDLRDVKLAIDFLQTNGFLDIYLVGQEVGALSVLRYMATHKDRRVNGVAMVDPVGDLDVWLKDAVGADAYGAAVREAAIAARQGAGMDYRIDLFPDTGPTVTQQAGSFLAWWSPMADTKLSTSFHETAVPLMIIAESGSQLPEILRRELPAERVIEKSAGPRHAYASKLFSWAKELGAGILSPTTFEMVHAVSASLGLYGLLWTPRDNKQVRTAVLLMHGLTSSPTSPLFGKMAPVLAQKDLAVLAVESHRSGWAGHETALLDDDLNDIEVWVQFLLERGCDRIVLAGASMGSLSIGRYQSIKQHPNIVALVHLMPTADCPDWFRAAAGDGPYESAVKEAETAIANGRGDTSLIDIDIRQPAPSLSKGRFRWTQRAASWLSWWGPDADSRNSVHMANANVPVLLLSGTADSYNDKKRFKELRAAAINAPVVDEIWYEDIDHGLAGVERKVAEDVYQWIWKVGVV